jgi:DNA repair protein RadC
LDISQGSVSRTPVHPRDVFCEAVRYRAFAIIVAHNHPSGDPEPSNEDIEITERLIETGKLLGIKGHVDFNIYNGSYYDLRQMTIGSMETIGEKAYKE